MKQTTPPTPQEKAASVAVTSLFIESLCEATKDWTLGAQHLNLLMQLYIHGDIYQQDLDKYTRLKKSANSRNIYKLGEGDSEKPGMGLVVAEADLKNRKMNIVRLTQRGRALVEGAAVEAARFLPKQ